MQARRDVPREVLPAVASLAPLPADECPWATAAWDAWDGARRVATAERAALLPDAVAGKSADLESGVRAQAGLVPLDAAVLVAAEEPDKRGEARSAV